MYATLAFPRKKLRKLIFKELLKKKVSSAILQNVKINQQQVFLNKKISKNIEINLLNFN